MSELKKLQFKFSEALGYLLRWCLREDIYVQFGETYRSPEETKRLYEKGVGAKISAHMNRLAVDLILYYVLEDGSIKEQSREMYAAAGKVWCGTHPAARWGGNFKNKKYDDIYHFSFEYRGVK